MLQIYPVSGLGMERYCEAQSECRWSGGGGGELYCSGMHALSPAAVVSCGESYSLHEPIQRRYSFEALRNCEYGISCRAKRGHSLEMLHCPTTIPDPGQARNGRSRTTGNGARPKRLIWPGLASSTNDYGLKIELSPSRPGFRWARFPVLIPETGGCTNASLGWSAGGWLACISA